MLSPNDNKFVVFKDRDFIEFKCRFMPLKHCFINPEEIVTFQIMDPVSGSTFERINYSLGTTYELESMINKEDIRESELGMLPFLIGDIHKYKRDALIYISAIMGYVVLYDETGKIKSAFKLIDTAEFVESEDKSKRVLGSDSPLIRFPRREEYLFVSSCIYKDFLIILSDNTLEQTEEYIIDVYSLKNNSYQYSMKLNSSEEVLWMHVTGDRLFIVQNNGQVKVVRYKIQ